MTRRLVLVVDDDPSVTRVLGGLLGQAGYGVETAPTAEAALPILENRPVDAVITDLKMPGMGGASLLAEIRRRWDDVPVLVLTAYPSVESAVDAMRAGAYDYLQKPFQREDLLHTLEKAILASERPAAAGEGTLVGKSRAMAEVDALVEKVARTSATVLLLGETGVGKEVVARAIHSRSPRAGKAFLTVHCAALPENLLESELFGYEKGAFTGAASRKPGRLELAEGGTLFLDEIGEVTPATQVKLLRILQDRAFERVGGTETLVADVRILAATHRDLDSMRAEQKFRDDLFYRLNVFPIRIAPLRERREDVPDLARQLLSRAQAHATGPLQLSEDALAVLVAYDWPGNVRELGNLLERLAILLGQGTIRADDVRASLPRPPRDSAPPSGTSGPSGAGLAEARAAGEKEAILKALESARGNRSHAAKLLGVSRKTLYAKLAEFEIQ